MDNPHKQSFALADLATRSVTLFPTRAQVVRDIKDVVLKPGLNEITVVGITPTADEHSIKVEGSGAAIITDIAVELLPNRDIFQEVYPESDSDPDTSSESEEEEDGKKVNQDLEKVRSQIVELNDELARAKELTASAERRLALIDLHANTVTQRQDAKEELDIVSTVETYRAEREKIFGDHQEARLRERELSKQIDKVRVEERRLLRLDEKEEAKIEKAKAKVRREKAKLREKERRREAERRKEKARIKKERENFWPRQCYTVRITLEASNFTPSSSRRSSIASVADVKLHSDKEPTATDSFTCDLTLSYLTSSAFWSPTYDLALNTQTNTAILCFDARLTNMTSETWSNAKVILSTSEANFSGLQDDTPILVPWRIKLGGRGAHDVGLDGAIRSREERAEKKNWTAAQNAMFQQKPRANLFGVSDVSDSHVKERSRVWGASNYAIPPQQAPAGGGLFGSSTQQQQAPPAGGLFGSATQQMQQSMPVTVGFGSAIGSSSQQQQMAALPRDRAAPPRKQLASMAFRKAPSLEAAEEEAEEEEDGESSDSEGAPTVLEATPELSFQESCVGEEGLTTNYELPNVKTLKPSSAASKQRVARISFAGVVFSRTVVAKYKPAAFLKARIRNTSKLTILKGSAGLTLDGTFLGRSTVPRCSAGDAFKISLGVDPGITVVYPKPDVKRSTTGVFSKGENTAYTRSITLANTRAAAGKPVDVTVLDQIPVSEEEKLKVDVSFPRGLLTGSAIPTGMPGKDGSGDKDWGRAVAQLTKGGEVGFQVSLNAGKSVKLVLEYELSFPTGEKVMQC